MFGPWAFFVHQTEFMFCILGPCKYIYLRNVNLFQRLFWKVNIFDICTIDPAVPKRFMGMLSKAVARKPAV